MLFYIGQERPAASILTEQARNMADKEKFRSVGQMVELAEGLRMALEKDNLDSLAISSTRDGSLSVVLRAVSRTPWWNRIIVLLVRRERRAASSLEREPADSYC